MTLVELLISAALFSVVAAAATTLLFAVSRSAMLVDDDMAASRRATAALERLRKVIHEARGVRVDTPGTITIWRADDYPASGIEGTPGDEQMQVSEMLLITSEDLKDTLVCKRLDPSLPAVLNVVLGTLDAVGVDLAAILANPTYAPYVRTEVWADGLPTVVFSGRTGSAGTRLLTVDIQVLAGSETRAYHAAIAPRTAGDYSNASLWSADTVPSGRRRRTQELPW